MQPNYEQQLYEWLWEVMLCLRLHPADLPMPVMQFTQQLPNEDELQGDCYTVLWKSNASEFRRISWLFLAFQEKLVPSEIAVIFPRTFEAPIVSIWRTFEGYFAVDANESRTFEGEFALLESSLIIIVKFKTKFHGTFILIPNANLILKASFYTMWNIQ